LQKFKGASAKAVSRAEPAEEQIEEDSSWRPNTQEFWLLKILLQHDETLDWTRAHLHPDWIVNPVVRTILEHRLSVDADGQAVQPAAILHRVESAQAQSLITEALGEDRSIPNPPQQLIEIATRLRNQSIDREVAALNQTLGQPDLPPQEANAVLRELGALRAAKRVPLAELSAAETAA
jgi:hypothetical protein